MDTAAAAVAAGTASPRLGLVIGLWQCDKENRGWREGLALTAPQRKHPVVLRSSTYQETVKFQLPAGFDVDELPEPLKLEAEFGSYTTSYEVKNGELVFKRNFSVKATTIPAARYEVVRSFFARVREAEQAPVVLAKK